MLLPLASLTVPIWYSPALCLGETTAQLFELLDDFVPNIQLIFCGEEKCFKEGESDLCSYSNQDNWEEYEDSYPQRASDSWEDMWPTLPTLQKSGQPSTVVFQVKPKPEYLTHISATYPPTCMQFCAHSLLFLTRRVSWHHETTTFDSRVIYDPPKPFWSPQSSLLMQFLIIAPCLTETKKYMYTVA